MKQIRYSAEQRQAAVAQMGAPHHQPIKALAKATGITEVTLRTWRREAIEAGQLIRRDARQSDRWSGAEKFRIVPESAPMSATELSEYARKQGVLPEQIARWRSACGKANAPTIGAPAKSPVDTQARQRVQALERELRRKDAALAETAALLVLQKKPRRSGARTRTHDLPLGSPTGPATHQRGSPRWGAAGACLRGAQPDRAHAAALASGAHRSSTCRTSSGTRVGSLRTAKALPLRFSLVMYSASSRLSSETDSDATPGRGPVRRGREAREPRKRNGGN